jgi:hypothetical protein
MGGTVIAAHPAGLLRELRVLRGLMIIATEHAKNTKTV